MTKSELAIAVRTEALDQGTVGRRGETLLLDFFPVPMA